MLPLKEDILQNIYEAFAEWSAGFSFACTKNCAACCTQNVTMTAVEGEAIHRLIRENGYESWRELGEINENFINTKSGFDPDVPPEIQTERLHKITPPSTSPARAITS